MSLDFEAVRQAIVAPRGVTEGKGKSPDPLPPLPPIHDPTMQARNVGAALETLSQHLRVERNLTELARLLGLGYFFGWVSATDDTQFAHRLGQIPVLIVLSVPLDGQAGMVIGRPEAGGPNVTRWTADAIFVRATVAGRYAFFVI